jgi:hypothetical protein
MWHCGARYGEPSISSRWLGGTVVVKAGGDDVSVLKTMLNAQSVVEGTTQQPGRGRG